MDNFAEAFQEVASTLKPLFLHEKLCLPHVYKISKIPRGHSRGKVRKH